MVVSRAVANLAVLSEYCIPYVKMDGYFIPYKSGEIEDELNESKKAIKILGGKTQKVVQFELPDTDIARSLVIIKKEKSTGMKYPENLVYLQESLCISAKAFAYLWVSPHFGFLHHIIFVKKFLKDIKYKK